MPAGEVGGRCGYAADVANPFSRLTLAVMGGLGAPLRLRPTMLRPTMLRPTMLLSDPLPRLSP